MKRLGVPALLLALAGCPWITSSRGPAGPPLKGGDVLETEWCFCILPTIVPEYPESVAHAIYGVAPLPGGRLAVAGAETRCTIWIDSGGVTGSGTAVGSGWSVKVFEADGAVAWSRTYVWRAHYYEAARALAADAAGRLYVAGYAEHTLHGPLPARWLVAAYAGDGTPLWTDALQRTVPIRAEAVVAEPKGGATVAGWEDTGTGGHPRWIVRRYAADGTLGWSRTGVVAGEGRARAVARSADGSVVVAGSEGNGEAATAWSVVRLGPDGATRWTRSFTGALAWLDEPYGVAVAPDGRIAVAGKVAGPPEQKANWMVRLLAPDGTLVWERSFDGEEHKDDKAYAVAFDGCGRILVAGYENGELAHKFPFDAGYWAVRILDANGAPLAHFGQMELQAAPGSVYALALEPGGAVLAAGFEQLHEPGKMKWSYKRPAALRCPAAPPAP